MDALPDSIFNKPMLALLEPAFKSMPCAASPILKEEIASFIKRTREFEGCIIHYPTFSNLQQAKVRFADRTEFECACNEIYMELRSLERIGETILSMLCELEGALREKYRQHIFQVIISVELDEYPSIRAWFHQVRPAETYFSTHVEDYPEPTLYKIIHT